mgnify:CR=1 FL=1
MDKNILKLIGVGVVAYYFLRKKKDEAPTPPTPTEGDGIESLIYPVDPTDIVPPIIEGCIDPMAIDYNALATVQSEYPCNYGDPIDDTPTTIQGCQDPIATNFNSLATTPCDTLTPTGTSGSSNMSKGFDGESYEGGGLFINSDY